MAVPESNAADTALTELVLSSEDQGRRLDAVLAARLEGHSRSSLAHLLKDGAILVNGATAKPSYRVRGGERVEIEWPEPVVLEAKPEAIPLDVLYEDSDLIVIHKPAGMVTHPSAGHPGGTVVNALLAHCHDLSGINGALRPGIVHRLDRDTSGVLVAAKNDAAHQALQEQFAARTTRKEYLALCHGAPRRERFSCIGRIGRHPIRRTEMAVLRGADEGREAQTDFVLLQRLLLETMSSGVDGSPGKQEAVALLLAFPKTGRTHQIRVHLAREGLPILADGLYGREAALPQLGLQRQALHAWHLEFVHPRTGKRMRFEAPLADDMKEALLRLGGVLPG